MACQEKIAQNGGVVELDEREKRLQFATQIFNEHSDDIRAIIRYNIRDESIIDDIYQDFFLSLVATNISRPIKNMRSFLYTAITNDIVSMARRVRRRRERLKVYAQEGFWVASEEESPSDQLIRDEEKERILTHLEKHLCPSEFKAVMCRFTEGGDNEKAAERLGIKKRSFLRYLCSALKKIKKINLSEEGLPG
jgi:RNA polymerase sigma factor (sigma-70 family)